MDSYFAFMEFVFGEKCLTIGVEKPNYFSHF